MPIARPLALALAAAGLVVVQTASSASAADSTVVVHGLGDLPADGSFGIFALGCSPAAPPPNGYDPGPFYIQAGPGTAPLGSDSWGLDPSTAGVALGPYQSFTSASGLTTFSSQFYAEGSTAEGVAVASVDAGDGTHAWLGTAALPVLTVGSWQTQSIDPVSQSFSWQEIDLNNGTSAGSFAGNLGALITHNGQGDEPVALGLGYGCNASGLVHFDDAQFGNGAGTTTYDFEAANTKTTTKATPSTITAGQKTTLKGVMTDTGGGLFTQATLQLWAKRAGTSTWKQIGHADETYDGTQHPASLAEHPKVTTQYRWSFAGTEGANPSTSKPVTVHVRTAVTAAPASKTVRKGGTITVNGRVSPKAPGHTVQLMRGSTKVGGATVRATGAFTIRTKAKTAGKWTLHVTIGATKTNLAGSSRTFTVSVGSGRAFLPARTSSAARYASPPSAWSTPPVAAPVLTSPFGSLTWRPAIATTR